MGGWGGCPSLTPHTHTRYKWYTSSLPVLAVFYFIFSKRLSFQLGNRRVVVHSNTTPRLLGAVSCPDSACVCVWHSSLCAEVEPVRGSLQEAARGAKGHRMPRKSMENLKLPSHCDAVPSIWKDAEAAADWQTDRQVEANSLQQNMCRLFRRYVVQCPVFDVIHPGSLLDRGCGCMPKFYFLRLNFAYTYLLMF